MIKTTVNGEQVLVEAVIDGKYYPATRDDPEELPDVLITAVHYGNVAITGMALALLDLSDADVAVMDEVKKNG